MVEKGLFYGVVAVLAAGIVILSTTAVIYYQAYQEQVSEKQTYINELNAALARADTLSRSYNASVSDFNQTLGLLAGAVSSLNRSSPAYQAASAELPILWRSYLALPRVASSVPVYSVSMKVDYGNGTERWYNASRVQAGWNGYVATLYLLNGDVNASWYPEFGEHFVNGLGGVYGNSSESWFVWEWQNSTWTYSDSVGVDLIPVYNGTVFAWTFCGYDSSFHPTCFP